LLVSVVVVVVLCGTGSKREAQYEEITHFRFARVSDGGFKQSSSRWSMVPGGLYDVVVLSFS
jgi:hypothetical protein